MSEAEQNPATALPTEKLHPPMHPWQTILLCLCTFSFYASFSLYRHARDLSIIDTEPRTRWQWFLSPLIALSLLFSLPRLFKRIDSVTGVPRWAKHGVTLGAIALVGSAIARIADAFEITLWIYALALLLSCVPFGYVQAASNDLKKDRDAAGFTSPPNAYTVAQWLALIFGVLLQVSLYGLIWWASEDVESLESYVEGTAYSNSEFDFSLTMHGDDWQRVETGTYSDGSATVEFKGSSEDHYVLVFIKDQYSSVDSQLQFRLDQIRENESPRIRCENTRAIDEPSMTLISTLDCSGKTTFGEQLREISHIREIGEHRIEILGRLAAPQLTALARKQELVDTVKSIRKLSGDETPPELSSDERIQP